jgi:NADH:ubiquinone oxidoreductase subunit 5 (subunit L)/multisubunit Na+/H+ antiporter MnhA subunit
MDIAPLIPLAASAVDAVTRRGAAAVAAAIAVIALSGLGDPLLDLLNFVFLLTALYSLWYVDDVERRGWYWAWLDVFYGSMLLFLTSNNWLWILAGWGGLDAASWALILTYRDDEELGLVGDGARGRFLQWLWRPSASALRAIAAVELGTAALAVGLAAAAAAYGPDIGLWRDLPPAIAALILIAAFVKSAQIPFTDWLMTAMSAPTPVSALLHSATMVAAGPILLVKLHGPLAHYWPYALAVGLATAVYGGLTALWQREPKVLLAASTASYLGLATAFSLTDPAGATALLIAHGFAKAALFMAVGESIHRHGTRLPGSHGAVAKAAMALSLATLLGLTPAGAVAKSLLPDWELPFSFLTAGYVGRLLLGSSTERAWSPLSAIALASAALAFAAPATAPSPLWLLALAGLALYKAPPFRPMERRLYLPELFAAVGGGLLAAARAVGSLDSRIDRALLSAGSLWRALAGAAAVADKAVDDALHLKLVGAVRRASAKLSEIGVEVYLYAAGAAALVAFVAFILI